MFWFLILLGSTLEVAGDVFFRKQAYLLGSFLYGAGTLFWALSLRFEPLSKAIVLFSVVNVLAASVSGIILFKETLTATQWVGVALGLGCLSILS